MLEVRIRFTDHSELLCNWDDFVCLKRVSDWANRYGYSVEILSYIPKM